MNLKKMNRDGTTARRRSLAYVCDLVHELVLRDLKLRYKRSFLGLAWSLLVPLAQMAVLYVVFRHLLPLNIPAFTTFLLTGILPWTWFQGSLLAASGAIANNREVVRQVGFPLAVLPAITVISQLIHFLLAMPILVASLLLDGYGFSLAMAALRATNPVATHLARPSNLLSLTTSRSGSIHCINGWDTPRP